MQRRRVKEEVSRYVNFYHKATEMIIMGFVEPFTKELPMEYAVELNRLIGMEMDGSVG